MPPIFDYGKALNRSWLSGTWQCALFKNTWTPDVTQQYVSGLTPATYESTGTNYARKTFTGQTITVDTTNHRADQYGDNMTWSNLTSSDFRYAVVFLFNSADSNSVLHSYYDFGAQSVTALDFVLRWNGATSNGVVFRGT